jgi:hypothetical protein
MLIAPTRLKYYQEDVVAPKVTYGPAKCRKESANDEKTNKESSTFLS